MFKESLGHGVWKLIYSLMEISAHKVQVHAPFAGWSDLDETEDFAEGRDLVSPSLENEW